jgi:hypothetical protein
MKRKRNAQTPNRESSATGRVAELFLGSILLSNGFNVYSPMVDVASITLPSARTAVSFCFNARADPNRMPLFLTSACRKTNEQHCPRTSSTSAARLTGRSIGSFHFPWSRRTQNEQRGAPVGSFTDFI